jgi:hypothetical protein
MYVEIISCNTRATGKISVATLMQLENKISCNPRVTEKISVTTHMQLEICRLQHTHNWNAQRKRFHKREKDSIIDRNRHHEPTPRGPQKTSQPTYASGQQQHKHTQNSPKSQSTNLQAQNTNLQALNLNLLSIRRLISIKSEYYNAS